MSLTPKELEVLQLRGRGLTQIEVAQKLGISQAAVSQFEKNAIKKILDAQKTLTEAKSLGITIDTRTGVIQR